MVNSFLVRNAVEMKKLLLTSTKKEKSVGLKIVFNNKEQTTIMFKKVASTQVKIDFKGLTLYMN